MITLFAALAQFDLANVANGLSSKTIKWYRWMLAESPHSITRKVSNQPLDQIGRQTLREYVVWLRTRSHAKSGELLRPETVNDYVRALHRFWKWCETEYRIDNPMRGIAYPKVHDPQPKALDPTDFIAMMEACGDDTAGIRNRALLTMLLDTGARAGGICRLLIKDVDRERRRALVTEKGGRARYVRWSHVTDEYMGAWIAVRQDHPTFFYNLDTGGRLTVQGLRVIIRHIARRAGVTGRVNPHSFRHAMARLYLSSGGDLAALSRLLGHREARTTITYYTIFTDSEIADSHDRHSPVNQIRRQKTGE
jgi:integrase/recombinase XerD